MTLNLTVPVQNHTDFTPRITVIGVGGGGTNAVDNMIALDLQGVEFVVANTDAQQLQHSRADRRVQLGPHLTQGLGAGAKPEIGRAAAEEAADELMRHLDGTHMVFITAGMGGGTGTGAAPVIARMARERGVLTVGVVTKPFTFEGQRRGKAADAGIAELQQYVDTLIVIPNQNLFRLANENTSWKNAFKMADNVLYMGVRGVTDLMVAPGLINLDFADIRTVMAEMGKAMMGTGEAEGENRAIRAAEAAISNPLLEDTSMSGARGLLINITGGEDMTLFEVDQAANRIREEVAEDANIIFGSAHRRQPVRPGARVGGGDRHRHGAERGAEAAAGRGRRRRHVAGGQHGAGGTGRLRPRANARPWCPPNPADVPDPCGPWPSSAPADAGMRRRMAAPQPARRHGPVGATQDVSLRQPVGAAPGRRAVPASERPVRRGAAATPPSRRLQRRRPARSLFGIMTGAMRKSRPGACRQPTEPQRAEPSFPGQQATQADRTHGGRAARRSIGHPGLPAPPAVLIPGRSRQGAPCITARGALFRFEAIIINIRFYNALVRNTAKH